MNILKYFEIYPNYVQSLVSYHYYNGIVLTIQSVYIYRNIFKTSAPTLSASIHMQIYISSGKYLRNIHSYVISVKHG